MISQPTLIAQSEQLEVDQNYKKDFLSQQVQSSDKSTSLKDQGKSSAKSSSKVPKKRRMGRPQIRSEENYMFPTYNKKEKGISYFNWKQQILIQNKISPLYNIRSPMPGCKIEMDEQKFRFMYELQLLQQEKTRFKHELEHYYSYQKKQASSISKKPQRSASPSSHYKDRQVQNHMRGVQWSLKQIGRMSLK